MIKAEISAAPHAEPVLVIEPKAGWKFVGWKECVEYRDLLYFMVLRDVTVLYKQTVLGVAWALLSPLFSILVFTVIFGGLLRVPSEGVPYSVFMTAGMLPWNYFAQSLTGATNSLIQGTNLFTKVYFPRVFIPLVPVFSKLLDFAISFLILAALMLWFHIKPSWNAAFLPLLMAMMMATSAGFGMFFSALAIQYRDIRHAMNFVIQALMYAAPVVWPVSKVPDWARLWYGFYPMAGVIEGFRAALLNTGPMPWDLIAAGAFTAAGSFLLGGLYFRRTERLFADVA